MTLRSYPGLAAQQELPVSIPIDAGYQRLAFSRDGRWLAVTGLYNDIQIQLFDLSNGSSRVMSAVGATGTYSPAFSEDGRELFVGGGYADGRVYVFDTSTGAELRRLTPFVNYVFTVVQVPGFRQLLVGGYDGKLSIIDAVSGDELWAEQIGNNINRASFSPDGSRLYAGTGAGGGSLLMYSVH
jgi:WD40 repeat protein